jgi:hypothetical protein
VKKNVIVNFPPLFFDNICVNNVKLGSREEKQRFSMQDLSNLCPMPPHAGKGTLGAVAAAKTPSSVYKVYL